MTIASISNSIYPVSSYSADMTNAIAKESNTDVNAVNSDSEKSSDIKPGYTSSPSECKTCKERTYQDGSNEGNVSFKNASHISPDAASAKVRAHEGEHVKNAYAKATKANGEVVNASVAIHTAVCPECGRTYVSGGTTTTMIKYPNESNPYQQNRKAIDAANLIGSNLNLSA